MHSSDFKLKNPQLVNPSPTLPLPSTDLNPVLLPTPNCKLIMDTPTQKLVAFSGDLLRYIYIYMCVCVSLSLSLSLYIYIYTSQARRYLVCRHRAQRRYSHTKTRFLSQERHRLLGVIGTSPSDHHYMGNTNIDITGGGQNRI